MTSMEISASSLVKAEAQPDYTSFSTRPMKRKRHTVHDDDGTLSEHEGRPDLVSKPKSLTRPVSPPPTLRRKSTQSKSVTAQVEAGERHVENHLAFFSAKLLSVARPELLDAARIEHSSWVGLYETNHLNPRGCHFVVHQHDHPVAGTHYDLRLQCNGTSSVSWAIMYGLPGDPNSRRQIRNATETRIHCLWNHLVETASHQTGTLLIWDTGEYEVLPYRSKNRTSSIDSDTDDTTHTEDEDDKINNSWNSMSEPEKLHHSFQARRIRLRLHGTRLPENYTISLWLRRRNDRSDQPTAPKTRRRKTGPPQLLARAKSRNKTTDEYQTDSTASSGSDSDFNFPPTHSLTSPTKPSAPPAQIDAETDEEQTTRLTNAYPGATNSINSIHQRRWYLALDRTGSGFTTVRGRWTTTTTTTKTSGQAQRSTRGQQQQEGFSPFRVLGREHERSVVTGRLAGEILQDEGVVGYVPRANWRAVVE